MKPAHFAHFTLWLGLVCGLLVGCRPGLAQSSPPVDWRFGIIESYESPTEAAGLAAWTRVRFQWAESQPNSADEWLPAVSDEQIEAELAAGREVVGLLIGIPDWARDEQRLPAGLWQPADDPANLWANFVRQVVARYTGRINHWVIWNEPDIWDSAAPGHTWDGTVADFAQLQRIAYLTAKEANPAAIIHLAAFTYFWDFNYGREQYFNLLLDELTADPQAAAHNYYFDVATAHLYFQPNLIYDILQAFRQMMAEHGLQKAIWLMETNAPPIDDPAWPVESVTLSVLQQEQAAFMPQAIAAALAAGAERVAIFKLRDTETDRLANPEPFGLLRQDGTSRPGLTSYQIAIQYLSGMIRAERERWNEVGQIRLDQGRYTTTVLFARLPAAQQAQVPANGSTALLVDMWGQQQIITAQNGLFVVDLPPAVCSQPIGDYCMIGGLTYYLVQAKAGESLPAGLPIWAISPTTAPLPTATRPVTATSTTPPTRPIPSPIIPPDLSPIPATPTPIPSRPAVAPPVGSIQLGWPILLLALSLPLILYGGLKIGRAIWYNRSTP